MSRQSWHGSRPPEENHIVVAAYRERDEARAERDRYRRALEAIAGKRAPSGAFCQVVARSTLDGEAGKR